MQELRAESRVVKRGGKSIEVVVKARDLPGKRAWRAGGLEFSPSGQRAQENGKQKVMAPGDKERREDANHAGQG